MDEQLFLSTLLTTHSERGVVLRGDAGVGKTAVIDQFCGGASAEGWNVVRAMGVPAEKQFALAGLHQIVFSLEEFADRLDERSRLILDPVYGGEPGATVAALPLVGALLNLLTVAAETQPVVLAVDDAQWLDDVSAQVLSAVGRRLTRPRVRIVAGLRIPNESLFSSVGWTELTLGSLSPRESRLLLDRAEPPLTSAVRAVILEAASGNPLALSELPRCVSQIEAGSGTMPLTDRLMSTFGERLELLEPAVRASMLRAALDGGAHRSRYVMHHVQSAVGAGLLVIEPGGRVVFRHPLVLSAVIHQADPQEIRDAHRELSALYDDVLMRRAFHLVAATVEPDQEVAELIVRAAKLSSRRGGLAVAIKWLRRAAELSPDPQRRDALFADAVFVAARAGRLAETQDFLDETDTGPDRSPSTILAEAYREFHRNGDVISTHGMLVDALSRADSLDDKTVSRLAHLLVSITNYAGNTRHWDRTNAALAPVEGRLNPAILMYRTGMDDIASTGAQLREVLTDRYVDRLPRMHARQVMLLAFPAYCVDTMGPFRAPLRLAYDQLCEHGASIDAIEGGRVVTLDLMATGRWEEAERVGRHCLLMSQQTQGSQLRRHQLLADLGLLAADRGNTEIARTYAARVRAWAAPRGLQRLIDGADRIEVRVALAEGDYDEAYRTATRISPAGKTPRHNIRDVIDDWFDLVEAAVRTERNTMAHQRADTAIRLGLAGISPRVEAMTLAMSAMSAPASEAGTLYRAALAHPGLAESPFHHARITLAQGIRLRRERKHTEARAALGAAAEGFDRLGSHPWAKQARIELLAATAPNTPGGSTTPTLTIQEQRIAELATAGLPTRQIADRLCISPRTVDAHLYRVFRKLDITKRSELSAALRHHRPTLVTATDSTNESP